jgi:LPS sulfotransferase NodH
VWEKLRAARDVAEREVTAARRRLAEAAQAEPAGESSPELAEQEQDDEDDDYARRFHLPPWSGAA